jgi:hypothetical protein
VATPPQRRRRRPPGTPPPRPLLQPGSLSPSATAENLHGLRRLPEETARARGWKPREPDKVALASVAHWKRLAEMNLSVNYDETPLADVCRDLLTRYGLDIHIDPLVPAERVRITFRVDDLVADQLLTLIFLTWHDPDLPEPATLEELVNRDEDNLRLSIDADGFLCVRYESQCLVVNPVFMQACRVGSARPAKKSLEELRAERLKGLTVSPSLVHQPLQDAVKALFEGKETGLRGWSPDAEDIASDAPLVSLIDENLDLEATVASLLEPAGLALGADENGMWVCTADQYREAVEERRQAIEAWSRDEADAAALAHREVRIEGPLLTRADVAAQLEAQLGERVILDPFADDLGVRWESDGLPQPAKDVLDLLAREERMLWRFTAPGKCMGTPDVRGIWIVGRP